MRTVIVLAPTVEPITLLEAKAQLRIEPAFTEDDDYINALISAARGRCESYCNQFFTEQGIEVIYSTPIPSVIDLPFVGLTVDSINYTDVDFISQVLPVADYTVDTVNGKIHFESSVDSLGFQLNCTTSSPVDISGVQQSIKIIVTDLYELRTETAVGVSLADNPAVKALLYPFRLDLGI
jgi:hypothetical protein